MSDHPAVQVGQSMSAAEPRVTLETQMQHLSELSDLLSHRLQLSEAAAVGSNVEDGPCSADLLPADAVVTTEPATSTSGAAAVSQRTVIRPNAALQSQAAAVGSADCTANRLDWEATPAAVLVVDTSATEAMHMFDKHRADAAGEPNTASSAGAAGRLSVELSHSAAASHSKPEAGVEQSEASSYAHQTSAGQPAFTVRTVLGEAGQGIQQPGNSRQEQAALDLQLWAAASDDEGFEAGNSRVSRHASVRDGVDLRFEP